MQLYFVAQFIKGHLLTSFKAQEAQIFYDLFAKKYLIMVWKIYTCDCLNNYLTTLEFEELDDFKKTKTKKKNTMSPGHFWCRLAVMHLYSFSTKDQIKK